MTNPPEDYVMKRLNQSVAQYKHADSSLCGTLCPSNLISVTVSVRAVQILHRSGLSLLFLNFITAFLQVSKRNHKTEMFHQCVMPSDMFCPNQLCLGWKCLNMAKKTSLFTENYIKNEDSLFASTVSLGTFYYYYITVTATTLYTLCFLPILHTQRANRLAVSATGHNQGHPEIWSASPTHSTGCSSN